MAKLIFSNGQEKEVDYNTAAEIYQILEGNKEPKNSKQATYVSQIQEVLFEKKGGGYDRKPMGKLDNLGRRNASDTNSTDKG